MRDVRTEFGVRTVLDVAAIILGVLALIGVAPITMLALAVIALAIIPFVPG